MMYLANAFFHLLHVVIILSSLFIWLFDGLGGFHLILQATILCSWLIIGPLLKKPGMCVLTELQKKMGLNANEEFPHSYVLFILKKLGYKGNDAKKVDKITFSVFTICTVLSAFKFFYY